MAGIENVELRELAISGDGISRGLVFLSSALRRCYQHVQRPCVVDYRHQLAIGIRIGTFAVQLQNSEARTHVGLEQMSGRTAFFDDVYHRGAAAGHNSDPNIAPRYTRI